MLHPGPSVTPSLMLQQLLCYSLVELGRGRGPRNITGHVMLQPHVMLLAGVILHIFVILHPL